LPGLKGLAQAEAATMVLSAQLAMRTTIFIFAIPKITTSMNNE
jgi:hypothetical protein